MTSGRLNIIVGGVVIVLDEKWKKRCSFFTILSFIIPIGLILRGITDGAMTFAPVVLVEALCFLTSAAIMVKGAISMKVA